MKNILVVKLSAIGDVIHALPVSYAIKETYPDAKLTWVAEAPAFPLLAANPCIDRLILFKKKEIRSSLLGFLHNVPPLRKELKAEKYDVSLDLQGLFKSAVLIKTADAKLKLGTCDMRELSNKISRPVVGANHSGHIVERYLDVARAIGCKVNDVVFPLNVPERECKSIQGTVERLGARLTNPYAVLAVGANWPNKRWGSRNFAKLSDILYERNIVPFIVGGGAVDTALAGEIESLAQIPPVNLVGKTNLLQLAHLMKNARVVVGGDTGPVHLAAGLRTKTVMLMGPTDANRNGPYGQPENAIEVDRACRYCWKRACPKGIDCLSAISVEDVLRKID